MNNHWRTRSQRVERFSDLDDAFPATLTELPLTRSQRRAQRRATLYHCAIIAAGLLIIAYAMWLKP